MKYPCEKEYKIVRLYKLIQQVKETTQFLDFFINT